MLLLIIKKESVHNVLSFRFATICTILFCLVLLTLFLMTNDYHTRLKGYATEIKTEQVRRTR